MFLPYLLYIPCLSFIFCNPISLSFLFKLIFRVDIVKTSMFNILMCVYQFMILVDHFIILIYAPFMYNNVIICILIECMYGCVCVCVFEREYFE